MDDLYRILTLQLLQTALGSNSAARDQLFGAVVDLLRTKLADAEQLKPLPDAVRLQLLSSCRQRIAAETEALEMAMEGFAIQPCNSQGQPLTPPDDSKPRALIAELESVAAWLNQP